MFSLTGSVQIHIHEYTTSTVLKAAGVFPSTVRHLIWALLSPHETYEKIRTKNNEESTEILCLLTGGGETGDTFHSFL